MLSSFVCDFFARFKIGGTSFSYFIAQQIAVLPPKIFTTKAAFHDDQPIIEFIKPRVLELVYTATDLQDFALELGFTGEPLGMILNAALD